MKLKQLLKRQLCVVSAVCIAATSLSIPQTVNATTVQNELEEDFQHESIDQLREFIPCDGFVDDSVDDSDKNLDATINDNLNADQNENNLILDASVPGMYASPTVDNLLAITNAYDPDGYYILSHYNAKGGNILSWWSGSTIYSSSRGMSEMDTAVHESCHGITFGFSGGVLSENYYVGNGNVITVPITDRGSNYNGMTAVKVPTEFFSDSIPSNLRTFRYDTYASKGATSSSNVLSVYGLLNEMNAYSWGANNTLKMLQYLEDQGASQTEMNKTWSWEFSILNAYAEFKYWTLGYMMYVRDNYPDVYANIMNNAEYRKAYATVCNNFENVINQLAAKYTAFSGGNIYSRMGDYNLLQENVLSKPEYVSMENTLRGRASSTTTTQQQKPMDEEKVTAFVTQLYNVCLDRNPDTDGLNTWKTLLKNRTKTGAECASGFVFSPEFKNKNYCNEHYVKQLYRAFMGREADDGGLNTWVSLLESGKTREFVFNGFSQSEEFKNLCNTYGITLGSPITEPTYGTVPKGSCSVCGKSCGVVDFVNRMYAVCLDRTADEGGLNSWCELLWSHQKTGRQIAEGFIYSPEFKRHNYSNEDYVEHLYQAFFGRGSDEGGKSYWVSQLNAGMSREEVFNGFVGSNEFGVLCAKYGIVR